MIRINHEVAGPAQHGASSGATSLSRRTRLPEFPEQEIEREGIKPAKEKDDIDNAKKPKTVPFVARKILINNL